MLGLTCIGIGGLVNAYRIYAITARSDDSASVRTRGAVFGFISGAILFGLPAWGVVALVSHVAK
jgi:hypothetical protein